MQRVVSWLGVSLFMLAASPAAALPLTQIQTGSPAPFTSLDGGVTQTLAPTVIVDNGGEKTATQEGSSSDQFCFGPGLTQCFGGAAEVESRAFAGFGVLRMETFAGALASPTAYGTGFPVMGTNPYTAVARTSFSLLFQDDIEVMHPTLPDGTPVQFSFTVVLDSVIFGNSQATIRWSAGSTVFGMANRGVGFSGGDHIERIITVDALVGDIVPISLSLLSGGQASAGFSLGRELDQTGFQAFDTATLNLDPITPGLLLRAFSEHDYASDAPAPPAAALLAAVGVLALAFRARA